ncbi:hypothetical protein [Treponema bryantii]|uniref:hypothetical protein n=1 Tax=Treponema bryantii TaxID=163 RepID=UPI002B2F5507|nr:hypothetical protein TRBR_17660 [Treponema bryantii]
MKKFFSVLLSILFAVCLLFTLLLSVVRFNFSYSSITKMLSEMMKPVAAAPVAEDGLFHPEDIHYTLAGYEDYGDFDFSSVDLSSIDMTNMDVNAIVETYLEAAGIEVEPEFVAEVLASPDISEFVDKYVGEVVDYMTGTTQELNINPDDILNVLNKSIDMYEEHTGEVVDRTGMKEAVTNSVAEAKVQLEESLDQVKAENAETLSYLKKLDLLLSLKFYLLCICVCVVLALILFLINRNIFVWLKYVFLPCFIDGLILFIIAIAGSSILPGILKTVISQNQLPGGVYEGIWSIVAKLLSQMKIYGIISAVLGIALFVFGVSLDKKTSVAAAKE